MSISINQTILVNNNINNIKEKDTTIIITNNKFVNINIRNNLLHIIIMRINPL